MKHALRALIAALAVVVLLPASAFAKGVDITQITIDGPGLSAPVVLDLSDKDQATVKFTEMAISGIVAKERALEEGDVPSDLGPAYTMTISLETLNGDGKPVDGEVEQTLYPFAPSGPYTETSAGQKRQQIAKAGTTNVLPGWSYFPAGLVEQMQEEGLPSTPPVAEGQTQQPVAAERPPPWLPWAILAGSVLIAVVMFVIGTRRS